LNYNFALSICIQILRDRTFAAMKEIEINMVINVPDSENTDTIMDKFINWVAENGWICGGGIKDITEKRRAEINLN
jgi:hypothetical protein